MMNTVNQSRGVLVQVRCDAKALANQGRVVTYYREAANWTENRCAVESDH
jgi:hypothetical protein